MANLDFRVLIETKKGRQYAYSSGSFINTDAHYVLQTEEVLDRINAMPSGSYINAPGATFSSASEADHSGSTPRTFLQGIKDTNQAYLSCSMQDSKTQGSIKFHNAGLINNDYLYRYKFYGNKVCNVLGLPENFWIYADHFQLTSTASRGNFLQGNVYAGGLNVRENLAIASSGEVSSDMPFKIKRDTDRWIKFTEQAGARDGTDIPVHRMLIGYSQDADRYEIRAGESSYPIYITGSAGSTLYNEIPVTFNQGITLPSETKLQFDSTDTFIQADASTAENLEIHADDNILLKPDGNVGIGNDTPSEQLTVEGKISCSNDIILTNGFDASRGIGFGTKSVPAQNPAFIIRNPLDFSDGFLKPSKDLLQIEVEESNGQVDFYFNNQFKHRISGSNVGIRTGEPTEALQVKGNISASGTYFGNQFHIMHHNFNFSQPTDTLVYLPLNHVAEDDSFGEQHTWIAPFDGELERVQMHILNGGNTDTTNCKFFVNGSVVETETAEGVNGQTMTFTFSDDSTFSAGDLLRVGIEVETDTGDCVATSLFKYDTST